MGSIVRVRLTTTLAALAAITCACSQPQLDENDLSASAVAYTAEDGSVITRDATDAEQAATAPMHRELEAMNQRYPLSELPPTAKIFRTTGFSVPATFSLANGMRVQIDGITCTERGASVLSRAWVDANSHIAFRASGNADSSTVVAEVWLVETQNGKEHGPVKSYEPAGHNAIGTGLCSPVHSQTNRYNERYKAFAELIARYRPDLVEARL